MMVIMQQVVRPLAGSGSLHSSAAALRASVAIFCTSYVSLASLSNGNSKRSRSSSTLQAQTQAHLFLAGALRSSLEAQAWDGSGRCGRSTLLSSSPYSAGPRAMINRLRQGGSQPWRQLAPTQEASILSFLFERQAARMQPFRPTGHACSLGGNGI